MSQVATKRKLDIQEERVRVVAHFREHGSVLQGTKEGRCERFQIELSLDSDEPQAEIADLMILSHRMCFTEDVLSKKVELQFKHFLNGNPIESSKL